MDEIFANYIYIYIYNIYTCLNKIEEIYIYYDLRIIINHDNEQ